MASIAQLVEHALRKRTVVGSIPTGGFLSLPAKAFIFNVFAQVSSESPMHVYPVHPIHVMWGPMACGSHDPMACGVPWLVGSHGLWGPMACGVPWLVGSHGPMACGFPWLVRSHCLWGPMVPWLVGSHGLWGPMASLKCWIL